MCKFLDLVTNTFSYFEDNTTIFAITFALVSQTMVLYKLQRVLTRNANVSLGNSSLTFGKERDIVDILLRNSKLYRKPENAFSVRPSHTQCFTQNLKSADQM